MASWLTAQLKAAEGLLEAVDKTVSRTVGTLALSEGDPDYVPESAEYGGPRPTGLPQQPVPPRSSALPSSTITTAMGTYGPSTVGSSATASSGGLPRRDSRTGAAPTPSSFTDPGFDARRGGSYTTSGTTPASGAIAGAGGGAGGFTVKADAPIPFGGPPHGASSPPASFAPEIPATRGSATGGSGGEAPGLGPYSGASAAPGVSTSYNAAAGGSLPSAPATTLGGTGTGVGLAASSSSKPLASQTPGPASASGAHISAAAVGSTAAGASMAASSGGAGAGAAAPWPPAAASSAFAAQSAAASAPLESAARQAEGAHQVGPPTQQPGQDASAPRPGNPVQPPSAAATRAPDGPASTSATASDSPPASTNAPAHGGPVPTASTAGPAAVTTPPPPLPPPPLPQPPSTAPQPAPTSSGTQPNTPLSPAVAASTLASAASAAATSLASTAVTHSLSFFNLVLDDAAADGGPGGAPGAGGAGAAGPAEPAGSGGGASAAAQQIASLTRTCEQLRKRLEASRVENEQLEDMLARAEVRAQQEAALVAALREELAGVQQARSAGEASLSAQLAVARSGLAEVSDRYEASQRTVLVLEGRLAALEESSRRLMEQHSDREGDMVEALRSELGSAESRLAAERKAHHATRAAAAAREQDLEQQIAGNTAALADLTRSLEEANRRGRELEEEVVEVSRARNDLSEQLAALRRKMEAAGLETDEDPGDGDPAAGPRRGGGGAVAAAAAAAAAELEVLRGEVSQHQRAAQLAKQAAEASQAQAARLAEELEGVRTALEQRKDTQQLEAQLREVSDMLYLKQTQMERLAADKAAQQLKTERELESARQELSKLSRQLLQQGGGAGSRGLDGPSSSSPHTHDVIPMDALGEPYQRLARNNKVGRAVKAAANFLDSTASTTSFVLRQYPLARLAVFGYAVLLHLYVYLLIARMQRLATHFEAVAAPVDG